ERRSWAWLGGRRPVAASRPHGILSGRLLRGSRSRACAVSRSDRALINGGRTQPRIHGETNEAERSLLAARCALFRLCHSKRWQADAGFERALHGSDVVRSARRKSRAID